MASLEGVLEKIEEKKKELKKVEDDLWALQHQLDEFYAKGVLEKFKIGDIIVHREKYMFRLDYLINGYARTSNVIYLETNKASEYSFYPQPICRLSTLLEFGRLANNKEVKKFKKAFNIK